MAQPSPAFSDNQTPPYRDIDLYASDPALRMAVGANGGLAPTGQNEQLSAFGRRWGSAGMMERAEIANREPPQLIPAPDGDVVEFCDSYHHFMAESMAAGLHVSTWQDDGGRAPAPAEVTRAARFYIVAQVENGHMCPMTMTRASVAALAAAPDLLARVMPRVLGRRYDHRFLPWWEKEAMTLGMGMTEKQGGTDVRTNASTAVRAGNDYEIHGQKWFMSAPMCDAFLVLAQAAGGLTCFFLPRFRPDGSANALRFVRLKDKHGNRSNASSEVEFHDAHAVLVGEEGKGIRTILQMVQLTRLDCAISSAGMMRMALVQALHHARHRIVFQKRLVDQPMMRSVLADMSLDVAASVAAVMRLARSFDHAAADGSEAARARLLTPALKYWICKRAPAFVYEAMECLGGNGYVEDSVLPRLYREAPVNAIWEGPGNVMALDVLRAAERHDVAGVVAGLARDAHGLPGIGHVTRMISDALASPAMESRGRHVVEMLAILAAAAALNQIDATGAAYFMKARLGAGSLSSYGTFNVDDAAERLDRVLPS